MNGKPTTTLSVEGVVVVTIGNKTYRAGTSGARVAIDLPGVPGVGHETALMDEQQLRAWAAFFVAAADMRARADRSEIDEEQKPPVSSDELEQAARRHELSQAIAYLQRQGPAGELLANAISDGMHKPPIVSVPQADGHPDEPETGDPVG